jgi:hypothetical protein
MIIVDGEVELDIEFVNEPANVDGNGEELMDVDSPHAQNPEVVDKLSKVFARMIDPVRLAGRA